VALRENFQTVESEMSFRLGLKGIQEVLVMALMIVFVFAMFYSNLEFTYKIGIGALVFAIIILTSIAAQASKQAEEQKPL
jgi:protein-S-isoprenylcysteine O-methyltransferase Ste14